MSPPRKRARRRSSAKKEPDDPMLVLPREKPAGYVDMLLDAERILDNALKKVEPVIESKRIATSVDRDALIALAQKISYTSRAPPGYQVGERLFGGLRPPAPPAELMQNGMIYKKKEEEEKKDEMEVDTIPPPPSGWKPGDPIDLTQLPPPPPGWKPGDPIDLPLLHSRQQGHGTSISAALGLDLNPDL